MAFLLGTHVLTYARFPFRGSNILRNYEFVISCKYVRSNTFLKILFCNFYNHQLFIHLFHFFSFPQSLHEFCKFTISRILKSSTWISTYHLFLSNLHFFIYRTTNQQAQKSGNYNKPHLSLPSKWPKEPRASQ